MRWVLLTLGALVVATATAFTIQNSTFTAALQLDLGFAAWKLARPASVPLLMWGSFGGGLVLGGLLVAIRGRRAAARVRAREEAAAALGTPARDPWAGA